MPKQNLNKRAIQQTRDRLIGFGANIIGVVFNESPSHHKPKAIAAPKPVTLPMVVSKMPRPIADVKEVKAPEKATGKEKDKDKEKAKKRAAASLFRSLK